MRPQILLLVGCTACAQTNESPVPKPPASEEAPVAVLEQEQTPPPPSAPTFSTAYSTLFKDGLDRTTNVRLAAKALDGVALDPGAVFSFNQKVGERTLKAGYKEAEIQFEGRKAKALGGGVCQVSSTLYAALMHGGFPVDVRHPHSRPPPYVPKGMDSSINWPNLDLKFTNREAHPISLKSEIEAVEEGVFKLTVLINTQKARPEVKSKWLPLIKTPFDRRDVPSKLITKPKLYFKGQQGTPGFRVWHVESGPIFRVHSNYKPLLEVWAVPSTELSTALPGE